MSKALTTTQGNGLAAYQPASGIGLEGFEDLGQGDLVLPRWSIIQPTSRREGVDGHVGEFVRNIDGEFRKQLKVVILKVSPTRILWSGDLTDRHPECVSRDGVTGSVYGACAQCQFNAQINPALRTDPAAKRCNYGFTLMLVDDLEAGTMALLGAMGTSVRPIKILTTQFVQRKRPAFSAIVTIGTEKATGDRGVYYVLKPTITTWLDEKQTAHWRELYHSLAGQVVHDYEDAAAAAAEAEPPF